MSSRSQAITTGPLAFWMTLILLWIGCTFAIYQSMRYPPDGDGWFFLVASTALSLLFLTPVSAALGGLLGLLAGSKLSRHYSWVFVLALGIWVPYLLIVSGSFLALSADQPGMLMRVPPWLFFLSTPLGIIAGLVIGIILMRRRLGFADPAARIARFGALAGLLSSTAAISWVAWKLNLWNPFLAVILGVGLTFCAAAVPALFQLERPEPEAFPVMPAEPQSARSS